MGEPVAERHHPPELPLVAETDRGDLVRKDAPREEPACLARCIHCGEGPAPQQPLWAESQAEFLFQFAQDAGLGAFLPLAPAPGQIPFARPGKAGFLVAQIGQHLAARPQQQLGASKTHPKLRRMTAAKAGSSAAALAAARSCGASAANQSSPGFQCTITMR